MDSERQIAPSPRSVRGIRRFALPVSLTGLQPLQRLTIALAVALIVYLPLEPSLIGGLPGAWYWVARLLPDGLVALLALAVVLFGDRRARTVPIRLLWIIGAVAAILVVANAARGFSVVDSINAIRVDTRYLVLGLLVWWAIGGRIGIGPIILTAVFLVGGIEIAAAALQIMSRVPAVLNGSASAAPSSFFFLSGTLGRYDRFGLSMMSVAIAIVATSHPLRRRAIGLLAVCLFLLYLSTARQAMVGLVVAGAVVAFAPRILPRNRALGAVLAVLGVVLVFATPRVLPAPPTTDQESSAPAGDLYGDSANVTISKGQLDLTTIPTKNFRLYYNLDVLPWAATQKPLLGFGPGENLAISPDPLLKAKIESTGISWDFARRFMADSNYASLVVQFGVIVPALFLLLLGAVTARVGWEAIRRGDPFARFATVFALAVLAAAWFGPAFEIRTVSILMWVALMAALAAVRRSSVTA
jgi:hypothetical protein